MEKNTESKKRLIEFISKYVPGGQSEFVRKTHSSISYVRNFTGNPTQNMIDRINEAYPQLNMDWVITGNGEMLRNISTSVEKNRTIMQERVLFEPKSNSHVEEMLNSKIEILESRIRWQDSEIARLTDWNKKLLTKLVERVS